MKKGKQGFASMDPKKQKAIASSGGKTTHAKGKAHLWSKEEAQAIGQKGGLEKARRAECLKAGKCPGCEEDFTKGLRYGNEGFPDEGMITHSCGYQIREEFYKGVMSKIRRKV